LLIAIAVAALALTSASRPAGTFDAITLRAMRLPVMAVCGLMVVTPRAAAWMSAKDLAGALNAGGTLPSHVSVVGERIGSLIFYLSPPLRAAVTPDRVGEATLSEAIAGARVQPPDAVIAILDNDVGRCLRLFGSAPSPRAHAGTFTLFGIDELRRHLGR